MATTQLLFFVGQFWLMLLRAYRHDRHRELWQIRRAIEPTCIGKPAGLLIRCCALCGMIRATPILYY